MKIYGAIQKIEEEDDGTIRITGIASTEDIDNAGEIVRADAIRKAVPKYTQYPSLREMHGLSAAGTTTEIEVGDDNITRIVGHVVDPVAIKKVRTGTYRGLSIGGKVVKRDPDDRKIITEIDLKEISLVDRPCNESCSMSLLKVGGLDVTDEYDEGLDAPEANVQDTKNAAAQVGAAEEADKAFLGEFDDLAKREFNAAQRRKDAKSGVAMKDGSFPIANGEDLENAIRLAGKAKDPDAARAHIKRRAAALGLSSKIPDTWKDGAKKADVAENHTMPATKKAAAAVEKTDSVSPAPINPSRVDDVLGDGAGEGSSSTTRGAPVAGKNITPPAIPDGGAAVSTEVKNPEEAGQATPDALNETDVAGVEHVVGEKPTAGPAAPRGKAPRNATQDTSKADGAGKKPDAAADAGDGKPGKAKEEREPKEEENDTQDTADKGKKKDDKKAADDPVAAALAAADSALKAATTVMQSLAKRAGETPEPLRAGMELRKGLPATGRLGCLLCELAYCLYDAQFEKAMEGDDSEVPAKLHAAVETLAAAYKAMSDEELQELLDSADGAMNAEIALAVAGGDLAKALEGVVDEESLAKIAGNADSEALQKTIAQNAELLKTVGGLTETLAALAKKVEDLEEAPLPPKTAVSLPEGVVAVSKAEDSGSVSQSQQPAGGMSEEEMAKALENLSEKDRAELVLRAALHPSQGRLIKR